MTTHESTQAADQSLPGRPDIDVKKENLISLATVHAFGYIKANGYSRPGLLPLEIESAPATIRAGEVCQMIIEELYRRDRINTLTYDERMELAMEEDHEIEPHPESTGNSWNDAYEAGRRVGLHEGRKEPGEAEAWMEVSAEANRDLDAYLREIMPELPEHYGMPKDGVRMVVDTLQKQLKSYTESGLKLERVL